MSEPGSSDVAQDARGARAQNQLLGTQRRADSRGNGVGVDVEKNTLVVGRQRTDHRHQAVIEQFADDRGVDEIDVTNEAEVDDLTRAANLDRRPLVGQHQAGIDPADADGIDGQLPADAENAGVDETIQHHGR